VQPPPRLPSLEGCHLFFKKTFCLLPRFASRRAPSLCEFQTPINNSQSETLIASLQLQKGDRFAIRLTAISTLPPQAETACWEPRIFACYLQPCVARSVFNQRASGRGQGFCTRLQQRSLAGAFLPCITLTFLARQSRSTRPAPHPMVLRSLNHLAGKQTSYSTT